MTEDDYDKLGDFIEENPVGGHQISRRQLAELQQERDLANEMLAALKHTVVATVGGVDCEGLPTSGLNYLQRLRILVEREQERDKLAGELQEMKDTFDLRWKADMRAIAKWREQDPVGRELRQPDHADLVIFLAEERDKLAAFVVKMKDALAELFDTPPATIARDRSMMRLRVLWQQLKGEHD